MSGISNNKMLTIEKIFVFFFFLFFYKSIYFREVVIPSEG